MTPWPGPAAGGAGPAGLAAPAAAEVSSAGAYAAKAGRAAVERTARAALVAAARAARTRIGRAQTAAADAGRLGDVAQLEVLQGRLGRLSDQLSTPAALGAWFDPPQLPDGAAAWLAEADRRIAIALRDVAARVDGAEPAGVVAAIEDALAEAAARVDARRAVLAADVWVPPPTDDGVAALAAGDSVRHDGQTARVVEVVRFHRGDAAAALDDGVVLWEDTDGRRLAFEAADGASAGWPPPPVIELVDDTFRSAWGDDGSAVARGAFGRRIVARPRHLYAGDGGGWLWLAEIDGAPAAWRGAPAGT